jgi:hypothetical protein
MASTSPDAFSDDFYRFMSEAKDPDIQDKKFIAENERIIKSNMIKLEKCIKENMNFDHRDSYIKEFACTGFEFLHFKRITYPYAHLDDKSQVMHFGPKKTEDMLEHEGVATSRYLACMASINLSPTTKNYPMPPNTYRIVPNNYDPNEYNIKINMTNDI